MIAAILFINEFQDYTADQKVGKNQLVVRLGKIKAVYGYMILMICSYISLIAGVLAGILKPACLLGLFTVPVAAVSIGIVKLFHDENEKLTPANAMTILNHLLTGLLIIAGYLF